MKFRNPKTGEVFENIETAIWNDCRRRDACDADCALFDTRKSSACYDYVISHPAEAARRMGMEVVEGHAGDTAEMIKENTMEQKDKPRICEVLGVEVGEEWRATGNDVATYRINEDGDFEYAMPLYSKPGHGDWLDSDMAHLLDFIEHPDRIIRKPRFTEDEIAAMRVLYAAGERTIERDKYGTLWLGNEGAKRKCALPTALLPSICPWQSVSLEEIT